MGLKNKDGGNVSMAGVDRVKERREEITPSR